MYSKGMGRSVGHQGHYNPSKPSLNYIDESRDSRGFFNDTSHIY